MTESLFLKNLWYFAMHGSFLKKGKLVGREILGERIVFGRDSDNTPFALRDNCPHRGVPLSEGWYDGNIIQCCYHGWKFDHTGTCVAIPALADEKFDTRKVKVFKYPCREINGTVWIYIPQNKTKLGGAEATLPNLLAPADKDFLFVEKVTMPADIDHAVIDLSTPRWRRGKRNPHLDMQGNQDVMAALSQIVIARVCEGPLRAAN